MGTVAIGFLSGKQVINYLSLGSQDDKTSQHILCKVS